MCSKMRDFPVIFCGSICFLLNAALIFCGLLLREVLLSGMAVVVIAIMVYLNPGGSIQVNCEEDR